MKIYLREFRIKHGLSIRELAELAEVSKSKTARIENGETSPTMEDMCKFAKALKEPITALYSCEE